MRKVIIAGTGHTSFGNLRKYKLSEILAYAALDAMENGGNDLPPIDQVIVGNMGAGILNHQTGVESAVVSTLNLEPASAEMVVNGPASGASAFKVGYMAIASGMADVVLVTAGELMRAVTGWQATDFVATLTHPDIEYPYGITLPGYAGMYLRAYMDKYNISDEMLSSISVRDHHNGMFNPWAHVQVEVDKEAISSGNDAKVINPMVAKPLRMYHTCPVSDGAAAAVLVAADLPDIQKKLKHKPVFVSGIGSATDTHCVHNRKDLLKLDAVRLSAEKAYKMAGVKASDIDLAELHDAFIFLELCLAEEAGLFPRGKAIEAVLSGKTDIKGQIPINPSGGLKSKGHPVGGTGMSQIYELVKQLRGDAEKERQVENPKTAMAINFGGFGNNVVTTILQNS